jgi:hypothetical protein
VAYSGDHVAVGHDEKYVLREEAAKVLGDGFSAKAFHLLHDTGA